jgi:hypothetical protein
VAEAANREDEMTHKYEWYIKKIADIMNGWESEANGLRPPCSDEDLADLRERSRIALRQDTRTIC